MFLRFPTLSGGGGSSFRRCPLVELGFGAHCFAEVIEGCCVKRAWRGCAAEGGPATLGSTRHFAGHTEAGIVVKINLDMTIATLVSYILRTNGTLHHQ